MKLKNGKAHRMLICETKRVDLEIHLINEQLFLTALCFGLEGEEEF